LKDFALIKPVKEGAVMTKSDLVAAIAEKAGIRKKDAEAALNAFIEVVTEALKNGDKVEIRGFGTFLMKERAPRTARNPRTGEKVEVPAKLSPAFKPGKDLKEATEKVLKKRKK
jgi:DNA-binding protein HU-beta